MMEMEVVREKQKREDKKCKHGGRDAQGDREVNKMKTCRVREQKVRTCIPSLASSLSLPLILSISLSHPPSLSLSSSQSLSLILPLSPSHPLNLSLSSSLSLPLILSISPSHPPSLSFPFYSRHDINQSVIQSALHKRQILHFRTNNNCQYSTL